ncbi:polymer-forming cytoskeletal protein [Halomicrobium urmianum]|uniref:polymer-forming cytoskeletal protein n=1 Tax=Halomicrobium urmianum TaxID=1586233 RepID=UPI001CD9BF97|nr:polymer-forming cytoskeletal protein [Halomicrobium urmianum]
MTRRCATAFVVSAVLLLSLGTGVAAAQSFEGAGGTIVVESDETYESVEGVAGSIVVRGTVTGDVSGVAGNVHVAEGGSVEGSIEAAAGTVRIDGIVGGDVDVGGGHVEVSETGRIGGDLNAGAGFLAVNGAVGGDVRAGAETIVIGPNANVGGEFRYDANEFSRDENATVAGGVVEDPNLAGNVGPTGEFFSVPPVLVSVYGFFVNLLLGAVLLAAFPAFSSSVAARVADDTVRSGGAGFLTLIAVPIALVFVAITLVGIPLAVVGAVVFGLLVWIGTVYGQYAVGAWALGLADVDNRWLALVVGLVGFALLGAIPVVGGLVGFVALLLGLGALALGLRDRYRSRREPRIGGRQATLDEVSSDARGPPVRGSEEGES